MYFYIVAVNNSKKKFKKFPITKLTITPKRHKCLGINLAKEVHELYTKNYITFWREIKDLHKWEDIPYA